MKTLKLISLFTLTFLIKSAIAQDTLVNRDKSILTGKIVELSETEIKFKTSDNPDAPILTISKYQVEKVKYQNGLQEEFEYVAPWHRKQNTAPDSSFTPTKFTAKKLEIKPLQKLDIENQRVQVVKRNYFFQKNKLLGGDNLYQLLLAEHNPKIDNEVALVKKNKGLSYLGFLAIPFAVGGIYYMNANNFENTSQERMSTQKQSGIACMFAAAVSFTYSIKMRNLSNHHLQKAVDAYNEKHEDNKLENYTLNDKLNRISSGSNPPILLVNAHEYLYNNQVQSEYQIQEIMLKKHDPVIQQKIEAARRGKYLRYLAFADIPLTAVGIGMIGETAFGTLSKNQIEQRQIFSSALFIGGAVCFSMGISSAAAYKKNTQRAVIRYNELYNN